MPDITQTSIEKEYTYIYYQYIPFIKEQNDFLYLDKKLDKASSYSIFNTIQTKQVTSWINRYHPQTMTNTAYMNTQKDTTTVFVIQDGTKINTDDNDIQYIISPLNLQDYVIILTIKSQQFKNIIFNLSDNLINDGYKYTQIFDKLYYKSYKIFL